MNRLTATLLLSALALTAPRVSSAMITGGVGNKPLRDPGWPAGAAALFNHPGRIAWWEGPPLGGGEWHSECRGDAKALAALLADFARLDAKVKRVVVHDGTGHSFWLAPNGEKEKLEAARIDWALTVWQPDNWQRLRQLPADLNPTDPADTSPPARIDVYTAGLDWAAVAVPPGIEVVDNRLIAHGFTADDGAVMEGRATDLATDQPIAATIKLQRVEPREQGGYAYPVLAATNADADGRWVLKRVPAGWFRVVVEADGFAPRVAGYARLDEQPRWQAHACGLARAAVVSGRVVGEDGRPMEGVEVSLGNIQAAVGGRYDSPLEPNSTTDAQGRFRIGPIPEGSATAWGRKAGYYGPGLGVPMAAPAADVQMEMKRAASVRVTVDFGGKPRPEGYIVSVKPEGGEVAGSYGGSAQIDANNQFVFEVLPPGRYFLSGRPNPGLDTEETEPVAVDLVAGQAAEITLKAR